MPNHLAQETSPYLLQHADNPVDWYPWCEEALALAREQNKPILLSIGYSACHWCHVMAHESFEDVDVAALMNAHFINIKVDREERPDLDHIYQAAHSLIAGRPGGWPLTMFLTPQQQPFFGGTYFPRTPRYQLPGFTDLLSRVAHFYHAENGQIQRESEKLSQALNQSLQHVPDSKMNSGEMTAQPLDTAMHAMVGNFDAQHGGFGGAPKFPHPANLELCLREGSFKGDASLSNMALLTLTRMAQGGVFDQLGGGFFRYSVDERWEIPHFEKMLYDNALLLALYADSWVLTRDPLFQRVVETTAAWVMREMQAPSGAYYATQDADSEHEEGKFYVWTRDELCAALTQQEFALCELYYGLDQPANFEGAWHLRVACTLAGISRKIGNSAEECERLLASATAKLFERREQRVRPGRDEKIICAWNGLMIKGMAHAARVFDRPDWLQSAQDARNFVHENLWRDGRLLAVHKDGKSRFNAYLDDYAFLLDALLELVQTEFDPADLRWATALAEVLLMQFQDVAQGDFFFTSHEHESLIQRPKPVHDGATPSGNAVAARTLLRLGHLVGETKYIDAAERVLRCYYPMLAEHPGGFASLMIVLQETLEPLPILILCGAGNAIEEWRAALRDVYSGRVFSVIMQENYADLPEPLQKLVSHSPQAWLCVGPQCLPAATDLAGLRLLLQKYLSDPKP